MKECFFLLSHYNTDSPSLFFFFFYLHQVITLEGWVDIMYYVQDAHSFYNFIYFILLIIVSIPLCFIFTLVNKRFLIF